MAPEKTNSSANPSLKGWDFRFEHAVQFERGSMSSLIRLFFLLPCLLFSSTSYIFLGAPGAGKGTQAFLLKEAMHIPHISVGDLFREQIKQKTSLGLEAQGYMDRGELVPTKLALDMLFERLSLPDCSQGCVIDGSSRNLEQAQLLVANLKTDFTAILFDLSDKQILDRIDGRSICPFCQVSYHTVYAPPLQENICTLCHNPLVKRDDDQKEIAERRLTSYRINAQDVDRFYFDQNKLIRIDAKGSAEEVFESLLKALRN